MNDSIELFKIGECNGNGVCNDGRCTCAIGWSGADCSIPSCISCWPNQICSNGFCLGCREGYEGNIIPFQTIICSLKFSFIDLLPKIGFDCNTRTSLPLP